MWILEHQYLPFWLFIFVLNVNHDAPGKETSSPSFSEMSKWIEAMNVFGTE
jgi:hypothetical protein